ncbi:hypothetical protein [Marinibactrum halimedae]|uniref:Uncharacterized protein n=1 Tax=Marinibactrum halimedae TaxID=1444977 RepID=A0AA37WKC0_9GAMM|nr:hypothetical protein [Marinibactrum halimedae]MCD9461001.1 hypothetical protein [Marinibactrum halimedae]GLS24768.1 hypothetical protein GCM10007877_04820 [Marinibactrum halimedae]
MAREDIEFNNASFEENIFYISQVQRCLVLFGEKARFTNESWFDDYLEDLYYSSFNREFKSFFLDDDGYKISTNDNRRSVLINFFSFVFDEVKKLTEFELEVMLIQRCSLDVENSDIFNSEEFLSDVRGGELLPPKRVLYILYNLINLLKEDELVALNNFDVV